MIVCLSPNGPMTHFGSTATSRLLVATMKGVAIIDRDAAGDQWSISAKTLGEHHVSALLWEPTRGGVFAGTHEDGIFVSPDRGERWSHSGLSGANVFSLECTTHDGGVRVLAGTEPVMLHSSDDYGGSWRAHSAIAHMPGRDKWTFPAPPHVAHLKSIAVHPAEPDVYYACIEQGALLKSADAGATWSEISSYARPDDQWYRDIHKLVPLASDPRQLFMSTGGGVYRSDDGGDSWLKLTGTDFPIGYPDHLIVSPNDEATVFVVGASTSPNIWRETHAARSVVMRSSDHGAQWHERADGLPVRGRAAIEAMSVGVAGDAYELFAANTDGEVYMSSDEGGSWSRIASGLAPVAKAMHAKYLT